MPRHGCSSPVGANIDPHALPRLREKRDFGKSDGTNGNQTVSPDAYGHYWNNIVSTESGSPSTKPAGYVVSDLVDAANQPTGFTLTTTEDFKANGRNNGGLKTPDADLLGDLAVGAATEDYFFIESAMNDKGAFILSGLDPARAYKFHTRTTASPFSPSAG